MQGVSPTRRSQPQTDTTPPRISRKYQLADQPSLQEESSSRSMARMAAAGRMSDRVSIKLQAIRTMLGYQDNSKSKESIATVLSSNVSSPPQQKPEKAMNLKEFVSYMRRRNQMVDEYLGGTKRSRMRKTGLVEEQNSTLREYSDMSVKYIHSFLPHGAMEDRKKKRTVVSSTGPTTLTPQRSRVEHHSSATEGGHTTTLTPQKSDRLLDRSGKSRTQNHYRHKSMNEGSSNLQVSRVELEDVRLRSYDLPIEVHLSKVEESYRGKNYKRELVASTRTQKSIEKQHRKSIEEHEQSFRGHSNSKLPSVKPFTILGCRKR